jgi:hypothetical protein
MKITISLVLLFLVGCGTPHVTYDEMEARHKEQKYAALLEQFEEDAEDAEEFLMDYAWCEKNTECVVWCDHGSNAGLTPLMKEGYMRRLTTTEKQVRWYRKIRHSCRFVKRDGL